MSEFMLVNDGVYEITFNPDDKHQYFGNDLRHIKSKEDVKELFDKLPVKYLLYQEISIQQHSNKSLSQNRLHYHGYIKVIDAFTMALTGMYKMTRLGDYQLNPVREEWYSYCTKQDYLYKSSITGVKQKLSNTDISYWKPILETKRSQE